MLRRAQRRAQGLLRRSSVHGELAWNRLVHSVLLAKGPLRSRNLIKALAVCIAAVGATAAGIEVGWPQEAAYMAGIFVAAALLRVTEALPLFATALLVVGFEILLLANPGGWSGLSFAQSPTPDYRAFLAPAADPILALFLGGFLLARACVKEGVDRALAGLILRLFQGRPSLVMLGLMIVTALFSMWMSNIVATAMMITLPAIVFTAMGGSTRTMWTAWSGTFSLAAALRWAAACRRPASTTSWSGRRPQRPLRARRGAPCSSAHSC